MRYVKTSPFMVKTGPQFDGGYHYRGRADHFFKIGGAFGKAMVGFLKETPVDHSRQVARAREQAKRKYGFAR